MRWALAPLLMALALPAGAHEAPADEYRTLQKLDQRLFETGWRLARANAGYCRNAEPSLGLSLHDMAAYPDPARARSAFGLSGDIGVLAVADGSPADLAGLAPDATLESVNEAMMADFASGGEPWQRLDEVRDAIAIELRLSAPPVLGWIAADGTPRGETVGPVAACPTRFEVGPIGERAAAVGARVVFGPEFPGFAYSDDEFAAAVAHELAHNLLGHRRWLDANGRKRSNIRTTEREADRLAPWLLLNAGYDPAAMIRMLARARPRAGGNFLTGRTHRGWDDRAKSIAAEIESMRQFIDAEGRADWSKHFERETAE